MFGPTVAKHQQNQNTTSKKRDNSDDFSPPIGNNSQVCNNKSDQNLVLVSFGGMTQEARCSSRNNKKSESIDCREQQ